MSCCGCDGDAPLGSAANPFQAWPGATFTAELRFWQVGPRVVVTTEGQDDPEDADPINLGTPARTGSAQLRPDLDQQGPPIATLTVVIETPQVGSKRGVVSVTLPATLSGFPQMAPRSYVFDVRLENDVDPDDVVGSQVFYMVVHPGVTRP